MENKPKKSKALIITIILVLILILIGFLLYRNKDSFGVKTSAGIAKMFSSLSSSDNSKDLKTLAQAGEDIKKGESVSVFGTGTNSNPIVVKTSTNNGEVYGYANQNIKSGDTGEVITKKKKGTNKFWNSINDFIDNVFTKENKVCSNGTTNYPSCTTINGECLNGATNPPSCTTIPNNSLPEFYQCTKDGVLIDCNSIPNIPEFPKYECKKDGVVVDCNSIEEFPKYECKKDGVVVDCNDMPVYPTCISPKIIDMGTNKCIDASECKLPKIINGNVCELVGWPGSNSNFPTVTMTASPTSIKKGEESTIEWTSKNAASCSAGDPVRGDKSGRFYTGEIEKTTSYTVTCVGLNNTGNVSANVIVFVDDGGSITGGGTGGEGGSGTSIFPTVTMTASPTSIKKGEESTIEWTSKNAASCSAGDPVRGNLSGRFYTGEIEKTTSYTVTCVGLNNTGNVSANVIVFVDDPNNPDDPEFPNDPNGGGILGNNIDLVASSVMPTNTTIKKETTLSSIITNQGDKPTEKSFSSFFTINIKGDDELTVATLSTTVSAIGAMAGDVAIVSYTFDTTGEYLIRACADKSSSSDTGIITETNLAKNAEENNCGPWSLVVVNNPSIPDPNGACENGATNYPTCNIMPEDIDSGDIPSGGTSCIINGFNASPTTIQKGETAYLSWHTNSDYCKSVSFTPDFGNTNNIGSKVPVSPSATTTYTLKAYNLKGKVSDTKTLTINVNEINKCLDIPPLTFTQEEKARLAVLLRKFYLISSTLRTTEDLATIYNEIDQQKNFVSNIQELEQQCKNEIDPLMNTNGWVRHGNPWYNPSGNTGTFPYTSGSNGYLNSGNQELDNTERILNIW